MSGTLSAVIRSEMALDEAACSSTFPVSSLILLSAMGKSGTMLMLAAVPLSLDVATETS